jgi:hypothetical protein
VSDCTAIPIVKHREGNNLMVWGCMGWNGVGKLIEVQEKINAEQYCEILENGLVESFEELEVEEGERIFQQDNDPKHTSKLATKWLQDNNIHVLVWPAQSPDLNISENTSSTNFSSMIPTPKVCMSYGIDWWRSGIKYLQRCVKTL